MRDPIDHERCSELLAPFVHGELDDELASQVQSHLRGCADCSEEHVALLALTAGEVSPLTELERARLRREVLSEAVPMPEGDLAATPVATPGRGARLYQVLGTAAVLALIGGFAYLGLSGGMGGTDSDDAASSTAGRAGGGDAAEEEARRATEAIQDGPETFRTRGKASDTSGAAAGTALEAQAPGAPSPTFEADLGPVDEKRLNKLGRSGLPLVVFSRAYTVDDVSEHQLAFIEEVAAQAPTARGEDIRACAGRLSEEFPNSLLAYAALAEFENRGDILVLAFAWTDEGSGPLAQSMVWAWSIGDCDGIPVHYSKNVIRPRR